MIKQAVLAKLDELSITHERSVVLGVSGGMDSMCLCSCLIELGYPVIAAHYNHRIRPESGQDADFVRQTMQEMGVEYIEGCGNVPEYASQNRLSIEAAARELRYRFLFDTCSQTSSQGVFVAHNADDQVETVLMNILRGAGLDGLRGMSEFRLPNQWSEVYPLIRPLLSVWRIEIEKYAERKDILSVEDKTNVDLEYLRNRVRHQLLPLLEDYNPGVRDHIWNLSDTIKDDIDFLNARAREDYHNSVRESDDTILLSVETFNGLATSLQNRMLRLIFDRLLDEEQTYDHGQIERVREFIHAQQTGTQVDVGGGVIGLMENEFIRFMDQQAQIKYPQFPQIERDFDIRIPSDNLLSNEWIFSAQKVSSGEHISHQIEDSTIEFQAFLDTPDAKSVQLRTRKPGDKIAPLGMNGRIMKLSDVMINQKIPRRAREKWPVLVIDGEIAWVPGLKVSEMFRLKDTSHEVVRFRFYRANEITDNE